MKTYVFGYTPENSPYFFYIGISTDPQDKLRRDIEQLPTPYGNYNGNKKVINRINQLNRKVNLKIIAECDSQDTAYIVRNVALYFCAKTVIFDGNHLSKLNYMEARRTVKKMIQNKSVSFPEFKMKCFEENELAPVKKHYKNWPNTRAIPANWVEESGWVMPKWVNEMCPPIEMVEDFGRIYLFDGQIWDLKTHEICDE